MLIQLLYFRLLLINDIVYPPHAFQAPAELMHDAAHFYVPDVHK